MKTYQEFLTEIFDSSFEFTGPASSKSSKDAWEYNFQTENGKKGKVVFDNFKRPANDYEIAFSINGKLAQTNTGEALPIFATVIKIMENFIKTHHPIALSFSATKDEESRVTLYRSLAKRFSKQFKCSYKEVNLDDEINFVLTL